MKRESPFLLFNFEFASLILPGCQTFLSDFSGTGKKRFEALHSFLRSNSQTFFWLFVFNVAVAKMFKMLDFGIFWFFQLLISSVLLCQIHSIIIIGATVEGRGH